MHYVDAGDCGVPSRGETLLLVHGNPTWSFHWRELIKVWSRRHRVIAPDQLGCGLSDMPVGGRFRLADRIRHLGDLIEGLELGQITLVAHDWGGAIGLGTALERPDRFARFVLLNTGAFPPRYIPWQIAVLRTPLLGKLAVQGLNLCLRGALRTTLVHKQAMTPAVRAGYLAPYAGWRQRRALYEFLKDIPRSSNHPTYATLQRMECRLGALASRPFLLLWGMRDWCFRPDCLDRFLERLPNARVQRFPDAGHWVVEDAPQRVADCVEDFLQATRTAALAGNWKAER
jgi:haloalkane dehalogenase